MNTKQIIYVLLMLAVTIFCMVGAFVYPIYSHAAVNVNQGGTGLDAIQAGSIPYGNTAFKLATTTTDSADAGKVLSLLGGIPTWSATSTLSTIGGLLNLTSQVTGVLPETNGGTGESSFRTAWDNIWNASTTLDSVTSIPNLTGFLSLSSWFGTTTAPHLQTLLGLTNASTTQLSVSNNLYTALTANSVPFIGANGLLSEDTSNFIWDDTNNFLGIGTTTPWGTLAVENIGTGNSFIVTDQANDTSPFTINASGQVGIGAYDQNVIFQVNSGTNSTSMTLGSNAGVSSAVTVDGKYGWFTGIDGSTGNTWIQAGRKDSATAYNLSVQDSGGNFGVGTTSPGAKLSVGGSAIIDNIVYGDQFIASSTSGLASSTLPYLTSTQFDATNYIATPSIVTNSGALGITPTAGSNLNVNLSTTGDFAVNTNQLYVDTSATRVGMFTTTPSYDLHVFGNGRSIALGDTATSPLIRLIANSANNAAYLQTDNNYPFAFSVNNQTSSLWLDANHNVGFNNRQTFGTSAVGVLGISSGTSPSTSPADAIQMWSADRDGVGGTAGLNLRTETGTTHIFSDLSGLGTTTPNNILDVYSTSKSAIGFSGAGDDTYKWTIGMDVTNGGRFSIASSTALGTTDRFVIDGNGNVGIASSTPYAKLSIKGSGTGTGISFQTTDSAENSTFKILDNGNIVLDSPDNNNKISSRGDEGSIMFRDPSVGRTIFNNVYGYEFDIGGADKVRIDSSGNFGIGTTSPWAQLAVENIGAGNSFIVGDEANDTTPFIIDASGNVGIGTTSPLYLLSVESTSEGNMFQLYDTDGNCLIDPDSGGLTTSCTSDARLKKNIRDNQGVLDWINKFKIRDFEMKSSGNTATGVIAQEVQEFAPEYVSESGGILMVKEPNTWQLIKAIQELSTQKGFISVKRSVEEAWQNILIGFLLLYVVYNEIKRRK